MKLKKISFFLIAVVFLILLCSCSTAEKHFGKMNNKELIECFHNVRKQGNVDKMTYIVNELIIRDTIYKTMSYEELVNILGKPTKSTGIFMASLGYSFGYGIDDSADSFYWFHFKNFINEDDNYECLGLFAWGEL